MCGWSSHFLTLGGLEVSELFRENFKMPIINSLLANTSVALVKSLHFLFEQHAVDFRVDS